MKKHRLLILLGPPGSGKSYFAERFVKSEDYVHVNSDQVRMKYFKNHTFSPSERTRVYDKIFDVVKEELNLGKNVVLDCNLLTNSERYAVWNEFEPAHDVLFIFFEVPPEIALERAIHRKDSKDKLYKPLDEQRAKSLHQRFEKIDMQLPHVMLNGLVEYSQNLARLQDELTRRFS